MWIPADAKEVERAARAGELEESPAFDAKAQLPENRKKNADLAVDVAAMSTDGGVLLYGVAEDDAGVPSVLQPLVLAGARERVDQIVRTSISEPPAIEVRAYPRAEDPATGYLLVIVPQSPRAPHQVVVRDSFRFYGRGPTGNRVLTESDIARLYERRAAWEIDREAYLNMVVAKSAGRLGADATGYGVMHAFVKPVGGSAELAEAWLRPREGEHRIQWFMRQAARSSLAERFSPSLTQPHRWRQYDADSWRITTDDSDRQDLTDLFDLDVFLDGSTRLMYGRATDAVPNSSQPWFLELGVAGALDQFLITTGALLEEVGYFGMVDVGVEVVNIAGAVSGIGAQAHDGPRPYRSASYRRTARLAASQAGEPKTLADRLISPLVRAVSGYPELDVWEYQPRRR